MSDVPITPDQVTMPTIGDQLGLGPTFMPGAPFGWNWADLNTPDGPLKVLRVSTVTGMVAFTFDRETLRVFAAQAMEQSSGLVLPT